MLRGTTALSAITLSLNMPIKECTLPEGGKGWQWGSGKCYADLADAEKQAEAAHANGFAGDAIALDRASVRTVDEAGRLHVAVTHISKANVCGYYGSEIPGADALGLDPTRMYQLYRDPVELEKAAPTFNNIPLLSKHVPVFADNPHKELVVGSTGTDAVFKAPYLNNSLVIWDAVAIAGIYTGQQCELSPAYWYELDMTPGIAEGVAFDGRMFNMRANHLCLVEVGRTGPDVLVADSNPLITTEYSTMKASRKAIAVKAALGAYLRPMLAQDAAIGDISGLVKTISGKTLAQDTARIVKAVQTHVAGKMAADAAIDDEALAKVIKLAADAEPDEPKKPEDGADKPAQDDDDEQREGESDEDYAKRKKSKPAEDNDDDKETKEEKKAAMDAAIKAAESRTEKATIARMNAIRTAEKEVQPLIGEVVAQDSAAAVYKLALDHAKVDVEGVDPSAYRAMVKMLHKPAESGAVKVKIAQDAATASDFANRFPGAKAPGKEY